MRILLIPDKFKGSLTARQVASAMEEGIRRVIPRAEIIQVQASDGGDGFLEAVAAQREIREFLVSTSDPLGRPMQAPYGYDPASRTAYIELAAASGMSLLKPGELDPMPTSTYGTGLLLSHACQKNAREIYLGLGGSATNDGGTGMAAAMGYQFMDAKGKIIHPNGGNLTSIQTIIPPAEPCNAKFYAVNDVDNPLTGEKGAARVYAPQKGANPQMVEHLELGLEHLDHLVREQLGKDVAAIPGAGAAGGAAYGLKAFLDASFLSGAEFLYEIAAVEEKLKKTDLLITGEGRIDVQTLHGKLIKGLVRLAKREEVPVWAVCGYLEPQGRALLNDGLDRIIEIRDVNQPLSYNMKHAHSLLVKSVAEACREFS